MIKICNISYADIDFIEALNKKEAKGKVHSVYRNCVNFIFDDIPLTLFNNKGELAPSCAVLEENICFTDINLEKNHIVYIKNNSLYLNDFQINYEKSLISDSTFPINRKLPQKNLIDNYITELYGLKSSILETLDTEDSFVKLTLLTLFDGYKNLIESLIKNKDIESAVNKILGLGFGLTPSGDDFITGLMLTLRYFKGGQEMYESLKEPVKKRLSVTTDVSRWMLSSAIKGKGRNCIKDLLLNIENNNANIEPMIKKVTLIGSTSGKDTCLGIAAGLYILKETMS